MKIEMKKLHEINLIHVHTHTRDSIKFDKNLLCLRVVCKVDNAV